MQITATLDDGTATLTLTTLSSTSRLDVKGARLLADDLERFVTDPEAPAVNRDYRVVPSDTGVAVHTQHGGLHRASSACGRNCRQRGSGRRSCANF